MSLILEALKKSEQERRRERVPDIRSIHSVVARRPSTRLGVRLLLPGVLLINAAVLTTWWWLGRPAAPAEAVAVRMPTEASPGGSPASTGSRPQADAGNNASPDSDRGTLVAAEPPLSAEPPAAVERLPSTEPLPVETLAQLAPSVREKLPAMTFSFHVYSGNPQRRSIIINERRLREGDAVTSAVRLAEITQDGVVLALDRHRIAIPVLAQW